MPKVGDVLYYAGGEGVIHFDSPCTNTKSKHPKMPRGTPVVVIMVEGPYIDVVWPCRCTARGFIPERFILEGP